MGITTATLMISKQKYGENTMISTFLRKLKLRFLRKPEEWTILVHIIWYILRKTVLCLLSWVKLSCETMKFPLAINIWKIITLHWFLPIWKPKLIKRTCIFIQRFSSIRWEAMLTGSLTVIVRNFKSVMKHLEKQSGRKRKILLHYLAIYLFILNLSD